MKKLLSRYRSLPIRARLSMLVAAAVAFAVAAVSVTCWFIVQGKLYDEINNDLESMVSRALPKQMVEQSVLTACPEVPSQSFFGPRNKGYSQVVKADGTKCVFPNSTGVVNVAESDKDVAANPKIKTGQIRNGTDSEGNSVRVLATALVVEEGGRQYVMENAAYVVAVPLKGTESTLNELALLLLLVSGIGVVGAGAAGLAVARAGLRPVDKLTEAVEHVARTEDLSIRIPVEEESEDEIARLSRSFNSMTSALANSRELQQQLIADAGHELRTPLTSLRTNIELLTRSEETGRPIPADDRKALLASVKAQMTELAALIGDLQELSRSESGQQGGRHLQVVDFQETVEAALRRARLRGPELTITADLQPWYVRSEPSALERAIVNILDNAVKFSPEGGTIEVSLDAGVLTVRDHGPGIPVDELPHVFDRFWRSPSARALPGSGLGLSIVARTVEQAGGEVSLARAEGSGTLATVRLPGAATPPPGAPE
ncbi:HAMP domain-containing sensor histidine kinase [Streptomyces europaeiscabiei]|uniref:HAMP domain-containing sensor histidine kinase n=1 Tax=Streptomyces europaeiscabiei TaxID=146819 RepID=UPI0029A89303|nr:HAMP domain-containing sensor histidine kinase [Streptomyces europaeiscabiei]MDX3670955.1 HAMP domain-containing sensor histidine kinase [Streptomyces europaeiscabiei]MDX3783123.1 HAMP domain-containing sensor histidine kinase [Streptomyces europaeiscabiei]MDX3847505.1 HAMP domain-containing sensor histidine kinase [Streptomyces europaeiscabiei]